MRVFDGSHFGTDSHTRIMSHKLRETVMAGYLRFSVWSFFLFLASSTAFADPIVEYTFHADTQIQNNPPNATFHVLLTTVQSGVIATGDVFDLHFFSLAGDYLSLPQSNDDFVIVDPVTYQPMSGMLNLRSTADPLNATFATFSVAGNSIPGSDIVGVYGSGFDYWNGHWTAQAIGVAPVPEPSTWMLTLVAMSTVCGCRFFRQRAKSVC